jgi:hypothetical protein
MSPTILGNQRSIARIALIKLLSIGQSMLKGLLLIRRSSVRSQLCNVHPSVAVHTGWMLDERATVRKELIQLKGKLFGRS